MSTTGVTALLGMLGDKDVAEELLQLQAEHDYLWTLAPFKKGDRVVLCDDVDTGGGGWWPYREIMVAGATGFVDSVTFSRYRRVGFFIMFKPEVAWATHDPIGDGNRFRRRYHCGDPSGDGGVFMFNPANFRLATDDDAPLTRPEDALCWGSTRQCADVEAHRRNRA